MSRKRCKKHENLERSFYTNQTKYGWVVDENGKHCTICYYYAMGYEGQATFLDLRQYLHYKKHSCSSFHPWCKGWHESDDIIARQIAEFLGYTLWEDT